MPTYQYACTACGHQLEAVQSFTDEPLTVCPACEGRLRKMFSSVGIVFKGSGFYRTDSRSGGSGAASEPAKAGDSGKSSDSGKSESKSDGGGGGKDGGGKSESSTPAPAQKSDSKPAATTSSGTSSS